MTNPDVTAPRPNWWQRNWKWFVPTGCAAVLALFALFVLSLVVFVFAVIRHTDVFEDALDKAKSDPQVRAELGEPIHEGWWLSGNVNTTGPSGNADISIPLKGARKDGTLYAVAHKSAGEWRYDRLEVKVDGREERIKLLNPVRGDAPPW
ncbi:MAG TPA: cytochrome c oxidase assembly factor Coa1 family protein [Thermoanaerobaculia bacterium]|nr:cytochrome c oxidase assembly factor Coa1 family protein [Thermoanaerobaculia bacterium]